MACPNLSRLFAAGCRRAVPAGLALLAAGGTALTQAATIIDGTTGSNTDATAYSTTGNLDLSLGFVAEYLIVGGGGGGGSNIGGGGGAGQFIESSVNTVTAQSYTVTVGNGGAGGGTYGANGADGGNSSVFSITAVGGGGGGGVQSAGRSGGSGGGGGGGGNTASTTATAGNNGGSGTGVAAEAVGLAAAVPSHAEILAGYARRLTPSGPCLPFDSQS